MNFTELFDNEDAVSPVIGVILMVAITVILAAVIGTFVLGLGDQVQSTAPQASFTFDFDDSTNPGSGHDLADSAGTGNLTIVHDGGDSIPNARLAISDGSSTLDADNPPEQGWYTSEVSAGSSIDIAVDDDDTIRVTWQSSDGSNTATLGRWTGPEA